MNLIHGKVYKYHDKNQNDCIAIYLCDTNVSSNVCIIPLKDNDGSENAVQITNLKKYAFPNEFLEIHRAKIYDFCGLKEKNL